MAETSAGTSHGCGCATSSEGAGARPMPDLVIVWQRLLADGETCPRCSATQDSVTAAVASLREALRPLGIAVTLEERTLDLPTFEGSPSESNRIWISGRPLEDWLGATAGASRCCSVCGDNDCRTLEVGGSSFEVVPERLIVAAGLVAASSLLEA